MDTIIIIAELTIQTPYRNVLLPVLQALVEGSRSEPGNRRYDLTESVDEPGHFFVLEEWTSEKALEEHGSMPHFKAFLAATEGKFEKLTVTKVKSLFS